MISTSLKKTPEIVSMLDGNLLPHRPEHLAYVVSVALIGLGPLSKDGLRSIFSVRRNVVRRALLWFKHHNPKHYGHIEISEENLLAYPEDDIPVEVLAVVRHCADASVIEDESSGYVTIPDAQETEHNRKFQISSNGNC